MCNSEIYDLLEAVLKASWDAKLRAEKIMYKDKINGDFENETIFDSICMCFIVIGEKLKTLDNKTQGTYLNKRPEIPWQEIIRMRDVVAHHYTDLRTDIVFSTIKNDIPDLIASIKEMMNELKISLSLRKSAIDTIVERTESPVNYFSDEQRKKITSYLDSEFEQDKNIILLNVWEETKDILHKNKTEQMWIDNTFEELMDLSKGIVRTPSDSLKP